PVRYVRSGGEGWTAALTELGIKAEDAAAIRYIYLEQEQIELSACVIGANPNALAKAHKEGCLSDGDLASIGFNDDDLQFLKLAGAACEKPDLDPVMLTLMQREMKRITGKQKHSQEPPDVNPGNPPGMRG